MSNEAGSEELLQFKARPSFEPELGPPSGAWKSIGLLLNT